MSLVYRRIDEDDLPFVERVIREGKPSFRLGAESRLQVLGRAASQPHHILVAEDEGGDRVGVVGVYVEQAALENKSCKLIGPFIARDRQVGGNVLDVMRQATWAAAGLGAARMYVHLAERREGALVSNIFPTVARRAFYSFGGQDMLEAMDFRPISQTHSMALPEDVEVPPVEAPDQVSVRPYDPAVDAAQFANVWNRSLGAVDQTGFYPQMTRELAQQFPEGATFVVEARGEVVGLTNIDRRGKSVRNIGIAPEWRGQGLGRALLAYAVREIRRAGGGDVWLEVESQNEAGLSLYTRLGFAIRSTMSTWVKQLEP